MRWIKRAALGLSVLLAVVLAARYLPGRRPPMPARFEVIAHRGIHQASAVNVGMHGCTAEEIRPPEHRFIENTLPSMAAAFDHGATMVEIDIHTTADGGMIVFHDWTVDCRTEGRGETQTLTVPYLKSLDVGHGYGVTVNGVKTYPFRGSGIGMMPTLQEVLDRFPDRSFLLNQKDGSEDTLTALARILEGYPQEQRRRLYYTGPLPERVHTVLPGIGGVLHGRRQLVQCFKRFVWTFGFGRLPDACRDGDLTLPTWGTRYIWGWPHRFLSNAHDSGSRVFFYVNRPDEGAQALALPVDGVVTDRIEVIGPWLRASGRIP
jgi:glycerophosphoryl diester phosphodiesterase